MKKLIIAVCTTACAVAVQAATVNWGGAIASPDNINNPLSAGQTALLLYSATAFTGDATSLSGAAVGATADNGGSVVSSWTLTDANVNDFNFTAVWSREGDVNGYYAILIVNEEGTKASYTYMDAITGTTAQSSPSSLDYNSMWEWEGNDHLVQNGYTVNVPEPTSGLLMLLGMAGLALRRKRA